MTSLPFLIQLGNYYERNARQNRFVFILKFTQYKTRELLRYRITAKKIVLLNELGNINKIGGGRKRRLYE